MNSPYQPGTIVMWQTGSLWSVGTVVEHHLRSGPVSETSDKELFQQVVYLIDCHNGGRELKKHSDLILIADGWKPSFHGSQLPTTPENRSGVLLESELQRSLAEMVELVLLVKQAAWSLVDSCSQELQELLEQIAVSGCDVCEQVAACLADLGYAPRLRIEVNSPSSLGQADTGFQSEADTIEKVRGQLWLTMDELRDSAQKVDQLEPGSRKVLDTAASQLQEQISSLQALRK